jgi:hypothetical protein
LLLLFYHLLRQESNLLLGHLQLLLQHSLSLTLTL